MKDPNPPKPARVPIDWKRFETSITERKRIALLLQMVARFPLKEPMSPTYNFLLNPPALYQGDSYLAFNNEVVTAQEYSQQIALPVNQPSGTKGVRVVIDASAAPGAGEFLVLEADNDAAGDSDYVQVPAGGDLTFANITSGPNGAGTRWTTDLIPVAGQMLCIYCKTAPSNAGIKITARVVRAV